MLDFVCRIKLEAAFVVTGVKVIMQYISSAEKISFYALYKGDFSSEYKLELFTKMIIFWVQVGGCRFFDMKYLPEVEALFDQCQVTKVILNFLS